MALTLYYLPTRNRAESTRMILKYGGVPFNDVVVSSEEWPKLKQARDIALFGQLPSISLPDGKVICQSGAIIRYVAKLANVFPSDVLVAADADVMCELAYEMNGISRILCFYPVGSEELEEAKASYFASLPAWLKAAEKLLGSKDFFGGTTPSYGDFAFFNVCLNTLLVEPTAMHDFDAITSWTKRMSELTGVREYLAERPAPGTPGWGKPGCLFSTMK